MGAREHEYITNASDCDLAERWQVTLDTMRRVWLSARDYELETGGRRVQIISGFRTRAEQAALARADRPAAPDDRSTHRSCPATGVDISLGFSSSEFERIVWGRMALRHGLRWGGGGPTNPDNLIPIDWQHVDRGPRKVS